MKSFKEFQKEALIKFLGMDKYNRIIKMFNDGEDLSAKKFTKLFNGFYRVRRDEKTWQKHYYHFFKKNRKNKNVSFNEILDYMYEKTGNIEASFSSKMLATINPDKPIWDKYVLNYYKIKVGETTNKKEKIAKTKEAYKKLVEEVNKKLSDKETQKIIKDFREFFPELNFSDVKILDFLIWSYGATEIETKTTLDV